MFVRFEVSQRPSPPTCLTHLSSSLPIPSSNLKYHTGMNSTSNRTMAVTVSHHPCLFNPTQAFNPHSCHPWGVPNYRQPPTHPLFRLLTYSQLGPHSPNRLPPRSRPPLNRPPRSRPLYNRPPCSRPPRSRPSRSRPFLRHHRRQLGSRAQDKFPDLISVLLLATGRFVGVSRGRARQTNRSRDT